MLCDFSQVLSEVSDRQLVGGEARRLFHGRGHCFRGFEDLVIDAYPPLLLIQLYAFWPEPKVQQLVTALLEQISCDVRTVAIQRRFEREGPVEFYCGTPSEFALAREQGLLFKLEITRGRNTGFFPDMAAGRRVVRTVGRDKKVLNLFAYSCGFSVAALAGGARQVVNVDMSRSALELGRENHRLNGFDDRRSTFLALEIFRSFSRLRKLGPFDLVICDPPATQGKSFTALSHWPKLLRRLPELLSAGGEFILCQNGPGIPERWLDEQVTQLLPAAERLGLHETGPDFPELDPACRTLIRHYAWPGLFQPRLSDAQV
ncbi:MAG: class I SAM-dependent methyltransferase [Desulfuromonadaceae bacterium]|nr:class I SAM-dependent methyltransferase [Desulfuromonadaceae bacterium]